MAGDIKLKYGSSAALTITLASLASAGSRLTGRESTAIDNTSNLYSDVLLGGKITTGTSPTVSTRIEVYVYGSVEDTPTYPSVLDGTDSGETFPSINVMHNAIKRAAVIIVTATSDTTYWFGPISVAQLFGGTMPKYWGVYVGHDTAVNLNATAGNHAIYYTPVYAQYT